MGFEELGEGFTLVDAHHDGVEGDGVHAGVYELDVSLHSLDSSAAQLLQECLRALVQAREQGAGCGGRCPDAIISKDGSCRDGSAVEATLLAFFGVQTCGQ